MQIVSSPTSHIISLKVIGAQMGFDAYMALPALRACLKPYGHALSLRAPHFLTGMPARFTLPFGSQISLPIQPEGLYSFSRGF